MEITPLHFGNAVQPQKAPPALEPCLAILFTMDPLHLGQSGSLLVTAGVTVVGVVVFPFCPADLAARAQSIIVVSA